MSSMKFELNSAGVAELMKSAEMQNVISTSASEIKGRAGNGYDSEIRMGKDRVVAFVSAETAEARQDNLDNNTLLKAVRG